MMKHSFQSIMNSAVYANSNKSFTSHTDSVYFDMIVLEKTNSVVTSSANFLADYTRFRSNIYV